MFWQSGNSASDLLEREHKKKYKGTVIGDKPEGGGVLVKADGCSAGWMGARAGVGVDGDKKNWNTWALGWEQFVNVVSAMGEWRPFLLITSTNIRCFVVSHCDTTSCVVM